MINSVAEIYYIDHPTPKSYSSLTRITGKPIPRKYPALACHYKDRLEIYNFIKKDIEKFTLNISNSEHTTSSSLYLYISSGKEIHVYSLYDYSFLFKIILKHQVEYLYADIDWLYINNKKYSIDYSWSLSIGEEVKVYSEKPIHKDSDFKITVQDNEIMIENVTKINFNNMPLTLIPSKKIDYIENKFIELPKNDPEPKYILQDIDDIAKIRATLNMATTD